MSTQRFVGPYQPYQNMLADAANRFTLLDPRTGKEATDLNRIAELNPNQHDLNILWSIHNDNRAAITTPLDRFCGRWFLSSHKHYYFRLYFPRKIG